LLIQLDQVVSQPTQIDIAANSERLSSFNRFATYDLDTFAKSKRLHVTSTGGGGEFSGVTPWTELRLALSNAGETGYSWVTYRFELRGPSDVVLVVGSKEVWRGSSPTPELSEIIQGFAVQAYLGRAIGLSP
jgi:hypothetical protein